MASLVRGLARETDTPPSQLRARLSPCAALWEKHRGHPALLLPTGWSAIVMEISVLFCVRVCACVCSALQWSGTDYRELRTTEFCLQPSFHPQYSSPHYLPPLSPPTLHPYAPPPPKKNYERRPRVGRKISGWLPAAPPWRRDLGWLIVQASWWGGTLLPGFIVSLQQEKQIASVLMHTLMKEKKEGKQVGFFPAPENKKHSSNWLCCSTNWEALVFTVQCGFDEKNCCASSRCWLWRCKAPNCNSTRGSAVLRWTWKVREQGEAAAQTGYAGLKREVILSESPSGNSLSASTALHHRGCSAGHRVTMWTIHRVETLFFNQNPNGLKKMLQQTFK